jgi:hypothetical protein
MALVVGAVAAFIWLELGRRNRIREFHADEVARQERSRREAEESRLEREELERLDACRSEEEIARIASATSRDTVRQSARNKLDDRAWERVEKAFLARINAGKGATDDRSDLERYLASFPEGNKAGEARKRLKKLDEEAAEEAEESRAFETAMKRIEGADDGAARGGATSYLGSYPAPRDVWAPRWLDDASAPPPRAEAAFRYLARHPFGAAATVAQDAIVEAAGDKIDESPFVLIREARRATPPTLRVPTLDVEASVLSLLEKSLGGVGIKVAFEEAGQHATLVVVTERSIDPRRKFGNYDFAETGTIKLTCGRWTQSYHFETPDEIRYRVDAGVPTNQLIEHATDEAIGRLRLFPW